MQSSFPGSLSVTLLLLAWLTGLPTSTEAQLPKTVRVFKTPDASRAQANFTAATSAARKSYLQALDASLKAAMAAGNLAEANAINATRQALGAGGDPAPAEFKTGGAAQARATYDAAISIARGQYLAVLQGSQKIALASRDLNEANAIQEEINELVGVAGADGKGAIMESDDLAIYGKGFTGALLADNELGWSNRDYRWRDLPNSLKKSLFTKTDLNGKPEIKVRAKRDTTLQVFTAGMTDKIPGWDRTGIRFTTTHKAEMVVFKRKLSAGEVVDIPVLNWACTLVVVPGK